MQWSTLKVFLCLLFLLSSEKALTFTYEMCSPSCAANDPGCTPCPKPEPSSPTSQASPPRPRSQEKARKQEAKKDCSTSLVTCAPWLEWNTTTCDCRPPSSQPQPPQESSPTAMDAYFQKCDQDTDEALIACDQDQDSGIQGAQTSLSNFAVGVGSRMGITEACSSLGALVTGANAAVLYFQQNCSSAQKTCVQSCERALSVASSLAPVRMHENLEKCDRLTTKVNQASQAMANMAGTIQNAHNCARQTETGSYDFCRQNPTALGCTTESTDCSNPQIASSNPICICKANPSSAACRGAQAKAGDFNSGGYEATSLSSSIPSTKKQNLEADEMFADTGFNGTGISPSSERADDIGGSKGGRPLMDGSGGSGLDGENPSHASQSQNKNAVVNAGFRGGGGGGGQNAYSRSGEHLTPPASQREPLQKPGPNLRDFLPNGKLAPHKNRGLAGISGPDGITGPHSDIWKKVQNRYQLQMLLEKLMP